MSFLDRLLNRSRVRSARQRLAGEPSVSNYVSLAGEHARVGDMAAVLRVCEEGLALYPNHPELSRLASRAQQLEVEGRSRELARELREAPRPALYLEMCELMLSAGRPERADEYAQEWRERSGDPEALLIRARARVECFFANRGREDGRLSWELLAQLQEELPDDERSLQLALRVATAVGAWDDALTQVSRLLELQPGEPELEARYRALQARAGEPCTFEQALRQMEKTGLFVDELAEPGVGSRAPNHSTIRAQLREMAQDPGVQATLFTRGSTALVQGPRGATAERTARALREVVQQSRSTARRLGLGAALEIRLEGTFGSLLVVPGDLGAGGVWRRGPVLPHHVHQLQTLSGAGPGGGRSSS